MSDTQSEQSSTSLQDIEEMKRNLAAERTARQAAEARETDLRRSHQETTQRLQTETDVRFRAQEESVASALTTLETQAKSLREQYQAALDAGNSAKASEINELWMEVKIEQKQAKSAKAQIDAIKTQPRQAAAPAPAANGRSAKAQAWIDSHPEYNTDQRFQHKVQAAHSEALADGMQVDSDDYFDFVNTKMGFKEAAVQEEEGAPNEDIVIETPAPAPQRKAQIVTAAPVSRSNGGSTPATTRRGPVRLTESEAEIARISMPELFKKDPAECYLRYNEHKQALIKEGVIKV